MLLTGTPETLTLPFGDPREQHIRQVLRMGPGRTLDVGSRNGPRGKAKIIEQGPAGTELEISWEAATPAPIPLSALIGLARPQACRRLLFQAACLGFRQLIFFGGEKGEPAYARSHLWSSGEWERHLERGAEQAFSTRIPEVWHHSRLFEAIADARLPESASRQALDVYEAQAPLSQMIDASAPVILALGPECGWSANERRSLRDAGWALAGLGERVLTSEAALTAAAAVYFTKAGLM